MELIRLYNKPFIFLFFYSLFVIITCDIEKIIVLNISDSIRGNGKYSKCYEDLGCIVNSPEFFHPTLRNMNYLPQDRDVIRTQFLLFTRQNNEHRQLKTRDDHTFKTSTFNPKRDTKIIVHGFLASPITDKWMNIMKDELLIHGDYNVIIVDWSDGSKEPYTQATANARLVGAEIAFLIQCLNKFYMQRLGIFHIIGHGLGSHVAGYAGERMDDLDRITGLDPVALFFQGLHPKVRLDRSDAELVDVIHSNIIVDTDDTLTTNESMSQIHEVSKLGMSQMIGHLDFYPNNGSNQPGCNTETSNNTEDCSHLRSVDFMTTSINQKGCQVVGFQCEDYETFLGGYCYDCGLKSEKCALIGLGADNFKRKLSVIPYGSTTSFYVKTTEKPPYCLFHYHVSLKLTNSMEPREGDLYLKISGTNGSETHPLSEGFIDLIPGQKYTFLLTTPNELGEINEVTLRFRSKLFPFLIYRNHYVSLEWIKIINMNEPDRRNQEQTARAFCDLSLNPLISRIWVKFNAVPLEKCGLQF